METLRSKLEEATAMVGEVLTELGALQLSGGASDELVLDLLGGGEELGCKADAIRVLLAGEAANRSRPILGATGLAYRKGCGSARELVERVTRIAPATARQRLKLGAQVQPNTALTGGALPAEFDTVRRGLISGRLPVDSAQAITTALSKASIGIPTDMLGGIHAAEHELVCAAIGVSPEPDAPALPAALFAETEIQAATWVGQLNPDGAEPKEKEFEGRSFHLHRPRGGLIPVSGMLLPEVAGQVQRVFDSLTNPRQSLNFLTEEERAEIAASGARDPRSRAQRQHDALATIFDVAGRSGELPTLGAASATMLVTAFHEDVVSGHGMGHIDGIEVPISMRAVRQHACTNGVQPIEFHSNGRVHRMGVKGRFFNRAQRRALAARDGGCVIPGCQVPAWACEAHHVIEWWFGGKTEIENGVLLCWFHHRTIETSGWKIRMVSGVPEVEPPPGMGDQVWRQSTKSPTRLSTILADRLRSQQRYG